MTPLIDQFPVDRLSREEEAALAIRARKGNQDASNKLVMHTMREALLYTRRTSHNQIDDPERVSLCYRKLMMIVTRFDPDKYRVRFFAFAKPALRGQMKSYWKSLETVRNAKGILSADALDGWWTGKKDAGSPRGHDSQAAPRTRAGRRLCRTRTGRKSRVRWPRRTWI